MMQPHHRHRLGVAHLVHRLSGLGLALFLPMHFYLLSRALEGPTSLNKGLAVADHVFFKIAEFGLVFLLAVHLLGGIRLLVLEWVKPVSNNWLTVHKSLSLFSVGTAFVIATLFFWRAVV